MNKCLHPVAVAGLALTLSFPAFAQDNTASEPAQDPAASLDMGTPVQPEIYVRETHDAWEVRCVRGDSSGAEQCQLNQTLTDQNGQAIAEVTMFRLPEASQAAAGAVIAVPLETHLPEGVKIAVDGGSPRGYQFTWCDLRGCYARVGFTEDDINAFKRGSGAAIAIVPEVARDQVVSAPMSLTGFTNAYDSLLVPAAPQQ